jgi:hypothetical protein
LLYAQFSHDQLRITPWITPWSTIDLHFLLLSALKPTHVSRIGYRQILEVKLNSNISPLKLPLISKITHVVPCTFHMKLSPWRVDNYSIVARD